MLRAMQRAAGATVSCIASRTKECRLIQSAIATKDAGCCQPNVDNRVKCGMIRGAVGGVGWGGGGVKYFVANSGLRMKKPRIERMTRSDP